MKTISKTLLLIITAFLLLQLSTTYAYDGPKENLHIYLLIGQSNMAGRAPFTKEEAKPIERGFLLNSEDKWEAASNPLNRYSTIRKGLKMQKMNPGYRFSQLMLEQDKKVSLGLVVNAKGGSSIKQWVKGSKFYQDAIKRTQAAQKTGTLKGILWHQGESDSKDAQYLDKLKALIENLRTDLKSPQLPFVAGQVNNVPLINDQVAKLPDTVANTGFISSEGLKCMDRWHFDAKSMKIMGERYAQEMIKLQK